LNLVIIFIKWIYFMGVRAVFYHCNALQLRVDNLETRAILGSSPWTITHSTEYNNDEEHGPHQKEIYNSGYLSIHLFATKYGSCF
jgi:hypothetical protein